MGFIEVEINNWSRFNPRREYKHPTWFALNNRILESPSMMELSAEELKAWIYILCQASQRNSSRVKVYFNHALKICAISKQILLNAISKLEKDESIQVHVRETNAKDLNQAATLHTNRQTVRDSGTASADPHPLATVWNTSVKKLGRIKKTENKRLKLCESVYSDYTPEEWVAIFQRADRSAFLCGGGAKGWRATFDWVVKNANRVDEGEFDDASVQSEGVVPDV